MTGILIAIIIILVLLLILAGIIYSAYVYIRNRIRTYSQLILGSPSISEGIKKREREVASTPKSVSAATNLYLPSIMKDFPEFHYDEMKSRAENVLTSFLRSVDAQNNSLLTEGTNELKDKLLMRIEALRREEKKEHFQNIRIHRMEIQQYRKVKGRCSVVFQSAVECKHYLEKDGKVIKGSNQLLEQSKYNVELIYIQDREQIEDLGDAGLGLNCPNCGAPLSSLGAKTCEYCGTPIIEFNIKTWNFSDVKETR